MITKDFTGGELDTLIALVEASPLHDGQIPSKIGRDVLIELGYVIKTAIEGDYSYYVATPKGISEYLNYFNSENISDAQNERIKRKKEKIKRKNNV